MHHTDCGLQATDDVSFADLVEQATGRRPPWAARGVHRRRRRRPGVDAADPGEPVPALPRGARHRLRRRDGAPARGASDGPVPRHAPSVLRGGKRRPSFGWYRDRLAREPAGAARAAPSPVLGEANPPAIPTTTEDTSAVRTYSPKPGDITRAWHVIDATDVVLGRLATQTAILLRGKHKPQYAPHMDVGDFVVIVNAGQGRPHRLQARGQARLPPLGSPGRPQDDQRRRPAAHAPRPRRRARDQGDAAAQQPRPADALQAQDLRGS